LKIDLSKCQKEKELLVFGCTLKMTARSRQRKGDVQLILVRNFSLASSVCTKIRSKLAPETLNALLFIKSFLKRKDSK
jgi:hypothetical protein